MATLYLEHYLDSLEQLPVELQRNFTLMRELDARSQELLRAIDKAADELLHNFVKTESGLTNPMSSEARKETVATIQAQYIKVKEYADDKVQLAIQTYELVDKHIRRLDCDLGRFEAEIQERAEKQTDVTSQHIGATTRRKLQGSLGCVSAMGRKKLMQEKEASKKLKKKKLPVSSPREEMTTAPINSLKKKKKSGASSQNTGDESELDRSKLGDDEEIIDMPVDPNEPTYCFCQQVSYGQMIGCDYPDCPIEWFHFACVNLTVKPKGKWYCSKCTTDKKVKK